MPNDMDGTIQTNSGCKIDTYTNQSLLKVFIATKIINIMHYFYSFTLIRRMFEILRFVDKIPVVCWLMLIRVFFIIFEPIYGYFYEIDRKYKLVLNYFKNGDNSEFLKLALDINLSDKSTLKPELARLEISVKQVEKKLDDTILEKDSIISDLQENLNTLKKQNEYFKIEQTKNIQEEILNKNAIHELTKETCNQEQFISNQEEYLKELEKELENYKFFFVLMFLTGINDCSREANIMSNETLADRPIKSIVHDLHFYKKKLISEKNRVFEQTLN